MSEDEKKDPAVEPEKPATTPPPWEDSHTAASLPSWWRPEDEPPTAQVPAKPPAHSAEPPQPAAPPAPPTAPPAQSPPAPPAPQSTSPADWDVSTTAKELPTWWRPETAAAHAAPTSPPAPAPVVPPATPTVPPTQAPPMPAPPIPASPMQHAAPTIPPPMAPPPPPETPPTASAPPMPTPPSAKPAPPSREEKTMVLGVLPTAPPMAILTVKAGPDMGFRFRLKPTGIAYMGRDTENDVVLDDPATSRRHAHIQFQEGAYVLTDLGSANGTMVNDQRVDVRRLTNGDVIKLGQDEIVISIM